MKKKKIPGSQSNHIAKSEHYSIIKKGQIIFHEGFSAEYLIIIIDGVIRLTKKSEHNFDSLLDIRHNGDVLGTEVFSETGKYFSTATAFTDCKILVVNRSTLFELKKSKKEEYNSFVQESLMKIIVLLQNRIFLIKQASAQTKIAYILLLFSDRQKGSSPEIIFSRDEMAQLAEVSRETASRELSYFNKNNIIKLTGRKILILDREKLNALLSSLIEMPSIKVWDEAMETSIKMFKD